MFLYLIESSLGQYIGISKHPKKRLKQHIYDSKTTKKCASSIVLRDYNFDFYILEKMQESEKFEREKWYINNFPRTINFQFKKNRINLKARIHKKGRNCNKFTSKKWSNLRSYTKKLKQKYLFN